MRAVVATGVVVSLVLGAAAPAAAEDRLVPTEYPTLAKALRRSRPGDRVLVVEPLTLDKPLRVTRRGVTIIAMSPVTVRGATGPGLRVRARDVTITGFLFDGSDAYFRGDGSTLRRSRFHGGLVEVEGDGATVEDNLFTDGGYGNDRWMAAHVRGDGATVSGNVFDAPEFVWQDPRGPDWSRGPMRISDTILVEGNAAVVRDNQVGTHALDQGRGVHVVGDDAVVTANEVVGITSRGIVVEGAAADVSENVTSLTTLIGVGVSGDDAVIARNDVRQATGDGIYSAGANPSIVGNTVDLAVPAFLGDVGMAFTGCPAIRVEQATRGNVADNRISHVVGVGMSVTGTGVTVERNEIAGGQVALGGLRIHGDRNVFTDNRITGLIGVALDLRGEDNVLERNTVLDASGGAFTSGVSVTGDGNRLTGNDIALSVPQLALVGFDNFVEGNALTATGVYDAVDVPAEVTIRGERNVFGTNVLTLAPTDEGVHVVGNENRVAGNMVTGGVSGRFGICVEGGRNLVTENLVTDGGRCAIDARGDANRVLANEALRAQGDGYQVLGTGNLLSGTVARDCLGNGVVNLGTATEAVGCEWRGNGTDVVGFAGFSVFERNVFDTSR